jgi:hypothetical protein
MGETGSHKARWRARAASLQIALVVVALTAAGCAGRHRGPRTLATLGAVLALSGSGAWAVGERNDSRTSVAIGVIGVAAGIATVVVAGGWMAAKVSCSVDPDCPDDEQCKEIPAPPGGIPYKQCVPR